MSEHYFVGSPCRKCGRTLRYRSSRSCVACARAYARTAYALDPGKAKQAVLRCVQAEAERFRRQRSAWRLEQRRKTHALSEARRRERERKRVYREKNAEKAATAAARRKLARQAASGKPAWYGSDEAVQVKALRRKAHLLSKRLGVPVTLDYIVPRHGGTVCGLHVPWNLHLVEHRSVADQLDYALSN